MGQLVGRVEELATDVAHLRDLVEVLIDTMPASAEGSGAAPLTRADLDESIDSIAEAVAARIDTDGIVEAVVARMQGGVRGGRAEPSPPPARRPPAGLGTGPARAERPHRRRAARRRLGVHRQPPTGRRPAGSARAAPAPTTPPCGNLSSAPTAGSAAGASAAADARCRGGQAVLGDEVGGRSWGHALLVGPAKTRRRVSAMPSTRRRSGGAGRSPRATASEAMLITPLTFTT